MARQCILVGGILMLMATSVGCGGDHDTTMATDREPARDHRSEGTAEAALAGFRKIEVTPPVEALVRDARTTVPSQRPVLPPAAAVDYHVTGATLLPEVQRPVARSGWRSAARPAEVRLPMRANEAFTVRDETYAVPFSIGVRLLDASGSSAEIADGYVVFRDALGLGAHLVQRPHVEGTEDYVYFPERPAKEVLRYEVDVSHVAGLRLVPGTQTLEFLADDGDPRLRMAPPYAVDAEGRRMSADVAVQGCTVDTDASPPWGRKPLPPGAGACQVHVTWGELSARYPLAVDPAWVTTGQLAVARFDPTATWNGSTDKLYVIGGMTNSMVQQSAATEVYSTATSSWAMAGTMSEGRWQHTAHYASSSNSIVVAGGATNLATPAASVEALNLATGTWATRAPMTRPRWLHVSTEIGARMLVAGGETSGNATLADAEIFDVVANAWTPLSPMAHPRKWHKALWSYIIGGDDGSSPVVSVEKFDSATSVWSVVADLNVARKRHAVEVATKGPMVIGGYGVGDTWLDSIEVYDATGTKTWSITGHLSEPRALHTVTRLPDYYLVLPSNTGYNGAVVAGGLDNMVDFLSADVVDYQTGELIGKTGPMVQPRHSHAAANLDVRVMVIGGRNQNGDPLASVEVFGLQAPGATCGGPADCKSLVCACGTCRLMLGNLGAGCDCDGSCSSGHCSAGICCDKVCDGDCEACTATAKGHGSDGTCEPVAAGVDPKDKCAQSGSGVCQLPGTCDGNGACATHTGEVCLPSSCAATTSMQNASTCDALGNCVSQGTSSCSPYICQGTACLGSCTTMADCAASFVCVGGKCVAPFANGTPCSQPEQCGSGTCAEGVCCDAECKGTCESCLAAIKGVGADGVCGPINADTDPRDECVADPGYPESCGADGLCDGKGACRTAAKAGTSCSPTGGPVCADGATTDKTCDGAGTCAVKSTSCAGYACDGETKCKVSCSSVADCVGGYQCTNAGKCASASATCDGDHTTTAADGKTTTDCAPYKCDSDGSCKQGCATVNDCAGDNVCDETLHCVPRPKGPDNDSSCGCSVPGSAGDQPAWWLAGLLVAMAARRARKGVA